MCKGQGCSRRKTGGPHLSSSRGWVGVQPGVPMEGQQGLMDGWMSGTVPWQAWLRGQGLMETDTDPDGAEGQTSRRAAADQRASSHLPLWVLLFLLWAPPLFEVPVLGF